MTLAKSISKFDMQSEIRAIDSLGNWDKNTHYKPGFIREMLDKYPDQSIVYIDVDAEFLQYPKLFDELHCDIAVHLLDHKQYRRIRTPPEILSGTIYFGNTERARDIITLWKEVCDANPTMWDQAALHQTLGVPENYYNLPPQYCIIHDYMAEVKNKVIVHYAASREQKLIEKLRRS